MPSTRAAPGSMLALMTAAYRKADAFGEVWYLPLADAAAAVAAAGSVALSGAPTAAGVISLYVAGTVVSVPVGITDTPTTLALALAAAITANPDLPVTAIVDLTTATKVDITAKNKGLGGNDIDLRLNYGGSAAGEATPAGLTVTIVAMASGATNPTLTTALSNLADEPFDFIVCPYTDSTSLDALKAAMNDQDRSVELVAAGLWPRLRGQPRHAGGANHARCFAQQPA